MENIGYKKMKKILELNEKKIINQNFENIYNDDEEKSLCINEFCIQKTKFSGKIKNLIIKNSKIENCDFSRNIFQDTILSECKLEKCNFSYAEIINYIQEGWDWIEASNCNFDNSMIKGCMQIGGIFNNCVFKEAYIGCPYPDLKFNNCDMEKIKIEGYMMAEFNNVNLKESTLCLEGPVFNNSNLLGAYISGNINNLDKITFKNTELHNVHFWNIESTSGSVRIDFSNTDLHESNFKLIKSENADFENCNLSNCNFQNVKFLNANLKNANLEKAVFTKSDLTNSDFTFANLKNISFENSKLDNIKILEKDYHYIEKIIDKDKIKLIK